jgi:hypothetical protein
MRALKTGTSTVTRCSRKAVGEANLNFYVLLSFTGLLSEYSLLRSGLNQTR